jgi:hypothetical protein
VQHYWGAKAIARRLDLKSHYYVSDFIRRSNVPVFHRYRNCNGHGPSLMLYTNDAMLATWELTKAMHYQASRRESKRAKREAAKAPNVG